MSFEHIPPKIRHDAAAAVFAQGKRLFDQATGIDEEIVKDRNKLQAALHYFDIADTIVTDLACLDHKATCLRLLGQWKEGLETYERLLAEAMRLIEDAGGERTIATESSRSMAIEMIAFCKEKIAESGSTDGEGSDTPAEPTYVALARHFGEALVDADYDSAHQMLSHELKQEYSKKELQKNVKDMISYADGTLTSAVVVTPPMDDWPDKKREDVGWVYVALEGDDFSEAVALTISERHSELVISDIEWGRP